MRVFVAAVPGYCTDWGGRGDRSVLVLPGG